MQLKTGRLIEIKRDYLQHSKRLAKASELEIHLLDCRDLILDGVISFCKHVTEVEPMPFIPVPPPHTNLNKYVSEWFVDFVDDRVKNGELLEILDTAYFLRIESLVDLIEARLKTVTMMMKRPDAAAKLGITEEKLTAIESRLDARNKAAEMSARNHYLLQFKIFKPTHMMPRSFENLANLDKMQFAIQKFLNSETFPKEVAAFNGTTYKVGGVEDLKKLVTELNE